MTSHYHVQLIAHFVYRKGIRHVVFAPGSRSAPFVIAFQEYPAIKKYVVADERVAGYFALGIAQQLQQPVAIICTSGTAVLNFAPAICEAYHQRVMLLALTADRPEGALMRGENQTINQDDVFNNYIEISDSFSPVHTHTEKQNMAQRINDLYNTMLQARRPVHWNVHIPEPLYERAGEEIEYYDFEAFEKYTYSAQIVAEAAAMWQKTGRIIVLTGLMPPDKNTSLWVERLSRTHNIVFINEHTANLTSEGLYTNIDAVFALMETEPDSYAADLVVTAGKLTISKRLRNYFKKYKPEYHIHLTDDFTERDLFDMPAKVIPLSLGDFLEAMPTSSFANGLFKERWEALKIKCTAITHQYWKEAPYSDFKVYGQLMSSLPAGCNLQLGNSTAVRYAQFFSLGKDITVNSNRGTSGIDGCVSTAAGAAAINGKLTVCIVGDVSFFYDSNAFWHNHLSPDFRVVVINNAGGNIFRLVDGALSVKEFDTFFETRHQLSAQHIASLYGLPYYICTAFDELQSTLSEFFAPGDKAKILEVKTNNETSAAVYKKYFEYLKQQDSI